VTARGRASLAALACALGLNLSGCAGTTQQLDVARPPSPYDSSRGPAVVSGYLTRPSGDGPFGAVVLLHGCSGLQPSFKRLMEWADWYRARSWVSMVLDSFGPRGLSTVCARNDVTPYDRAGDAYAALRYLADQPFVRKDRIVIQGLSHGGWTVLRALEDILFGGQSPRFAAGIAYYPVCAGIRRPLYAPAIVLIGELDDWTPAPPCRSLEQNARDDAHPMEVTIYPGAYHSFDFAGPRRINQYGKVLEDAPDATADSERRVDAFLHRVFTPR